MLILNSSFQTSKNLVLTHKENVCRWRSTLLAYSGTALSAAAQSKTYNISPTTLRFLDDLDLCAGLEIQVPFVLLCVICNGSVLFPKPGLRNLTGCIKAGFLFPSVKHISWRTSTQQVLISMINNFLSVLIRKDSASL